LNGGGKWSNVAPNVKGIPAGSPVSALETSHRNENVVYAAFDRHMFDDMRPLLFKTTDAGKTWTGITQGLPANAFIWVLREDLNNSNVLYLGTEVGAFISLDAGAHWSRFNLKNLPNVAVRDIFLQAGRNDILLATHGRGLYILDDATPIQQIAASQSAATLFPIRSALRYSVRATRAGGGDSEFTAANPAYGALLNYYLPAQTDDVRFEVQDASGKVIRTIPAPATERGRGVHRIAWDLRANPPAGDAPRGGGRRGGGEGGGEGGGGRGGAPRGPQVLPGVYTVKMVAGPASVMQKVTVQLDPELKVSAADLQTQWQTLQKISSMISATGDMLREAGRHEDSPVWIKFRTSLTSGRLAEQLQALFTLIDGPNDAPTQAMTNLLGDLESGYSKSSAEFQALKP
jgi:hypothetical protein